jgi:hypothetical protein
MRCSYPARTKHNLTPYSCFQIRISPLGSGEFPDGSYRKSLELVSGIINLVEFIADHSRRLILIFMLFLPTTKSHHIQANMHHNR